MKCVLQQSMLHFQACQAWIMRVLSTAASSSATTGTSRCILHCSVRGGLLPLCGSAIHLLWWCNAGTSGAASCIACSIRHAAGCDFICLWQQLPHLAEATTAAAKALNAHAMATSLRHRRAVADCSAPALKVIPARRFAQGLVSHATPPLPLLVVSTLDSLAV